MSRRVRWILLAVVVLLVGAAVALVVVEKPQLDDARDAVDARWQPLRAPSALVARYQKLEGALSAYDAAGGTSRSVSRDAHAALGAWTSALRDGGAHAQAVAANRVEAQAARLSANVIGSDRFRGVKSVTDAIAAFAGTRPPPSAVRAYNAAVRHYEDVRTDTLRRPLARVLGYDSRPELQLGG